MRPKPYPFTEELLKGLGFIEIFESQVEKFDKMCDEYYKNLSKRGVD
jgi:hypothetical protein